MSVLFHLLRWVLTYLPPTLILASVYNYLAEPYEVRYWKHTIQGSYEAVETVVKNASNSAQYVTLTFTSGSGELHDVGFRPLVENVHESSLRSILPSLEGKIRPFFRGGESEYARWEVLLDPHLPGGLEYLERLLVSNLRFRIQHALDRNFQTSFSKAARERLVNSFMVSPDKHHLEGVQFPGASRKQLGRAEQVLRSVHAQWESEVQEVKTELSARFRDITESNVVFGPSTFTADGVIRVAMNLHPRRSCVFIFHTGRNAVDSDLRVHVEGAGDGYKAGSMGELERNILVLAFINNPVIFLI